MSNAANVTGLSPPVSSVRSFKPTSAKAARGESSYLTRMTKEAAWQQINKRR